MTNAERIQANNTELLECIEMAEQLPDAGGATAEKPEQEKTVETTQNGTVEVLPDEGYVLTKASVVVDVQPILQDKTVTPSYINQFISADAGYDGLGTVKVLGMDEDLIIPSGTLEINENGRHDVEEYKYVQVDVPSGGGGSDLGALLSNTLTALENSDATSLRPRAFQQATALTTVTLPNVTAIGQYAFYGCTGLKTVTIPNATTTSSQAFYNCTKLAYCDLGSCSSIAASCFNACTSLVTLILRRTSGICTISNATNVINNTPIGNGAGYVYVPRALVDTYKANTNWTTFAAQIRAIEDYPDICG